MEPFASNWLENLIAICGLGLGLGLGLVLLIMHAICRSYKYLRQIRLNSSQKNFMEIMKDADAVSVTLFGSPPRNVVEYLLTKYNITADKIKWKSKLGILLEIPPSLVPTEFGDWINEVKLDKIT